MPIKKFVLAEIPYVCLAFGSLAGACFDHAQYTSSILLTPLSLAGVVVFVVSQALMWWKVEDAAFEAKRDPFDRP